MIIIKFKMKSCFYHKDLIMLKKISTSILLLTAAHSSFLAADYGDTSKNSNMNGHAHSEMKSGGSNPPMKEVTPPAGPMVSDGADVFITASYILWKTSTGNTDILSAGSSKVDTTPATGLIQSSGRRSANTTLSYDWDSGFKVGLGVNLPTDGWSLYADYTWLRPNASVSYSLTAQDEVALCIPTYGMGFPSQLQGPGRTARYEDFSYNNINLVIGRNFYVSKCFTLNPYAGLLGTWQNWNIRSTSNNSVITGVLTNLNPFTNTFNPITTRLDNSIWGIGVLAGFDMGMFLTKEFSLYANISGSGIFQSYQRNDRTDYTSRYVSVNPPTTIESTARQEQTNYKFAPLLCFELGMKYEVYFDEDQYCFSLQAGWESKWYSDWLYDAIERNTNSLTLGGLEVKARFDF